MSEQTAGHNLTNVRRGLATVALLKARFDEGLDHLTMFQPFVNDAIRQYQVDDIDVPGIQKAVKDLSGLLVPAEIVKTLLRRARKRGLLRRHGGRYLRTSQISKDPEYSVLIRRFLQVHTGLASSLREFAESQGQHLATDDDALSALMQFLDEHHIGLVLGQSVVESSSNTVERIDQVIAAFVTSVINENGPLRSVLDDIVKGLIVQNTLLLRDVPIRGRHLKGLTVFLDTGVLLRALGYAGPTEELAAKEALNLIHSAGASLRVFNRTVNEVEGILELYERKLGNPAGTKSLRSTPLTHHFLKIKTTPGDIRKMILLLRTNLENMGIKTEEFPTHINEFTEDEKALADALKGPTNTDDDYEERVWHDVQAVAAVLTLRKGAQARRMAYSKYVFASNSSPVVASAVEWYHDRNPHTFEPIVHFRSITNVAWFLRPANASNVPIHELVAVCTAVLQPSNELWSRFIRGLDELVQSGELSDDESIAVLANGFTQIEPGELESESDMEANNVREIVERVREEREGELRSELDNKQKQIESRNHEVAVARYEADSIRDTVNARTKQIAVIIARVIYSGLFIVVLTGAIFSLLTEWSNWTRSGVIWLLVWWGCVGAFLGTSLLPFFIPRFHGLNFLNRLQNFIALRLQRMLLPENKHD